MNFAEYSQRHCVDAFPWRPSMKPHIKRIDGLWYCAGGRWLAFDYTPTKAYEQWKKEQDFGWLAVKAMSL